VQLDAYRVGPTGDLVAAAGTFERAFALPPGGAVIARPDGHLAWSAAGVIDDAPDVIEDMLTRLLCRKGAGHFA
jgi:hypothetical protein